MPDLHTLPTGSRPVAAIRNNGPEGLVLERMKLRELAEGWPCYRQVGLSHHVVATVALTQSHSDACEWQNLESIFHPNAYIYTTWTGRTFYKDFIEASKAGMDRGTFIMHRVHGSTTDIRTDATRAVTKMKATVTQRFDLDGVQVDAESDCRFCFFWSKDPVTGNWGANLVRHWYEKDKLIPIDPRRVPQLDYGVLNKFPPGYKYLAYCQEMTMGVEVMLDMPGHRREGDSVCGQKHDLLYLQAKDWLDGLEIVI